MDSFQILYRGVGGHDLGCYLKWWPCLYFQGHYVTFYVLILSLCKLNNPQVTGADNLKLLHRVTLNGLQIVLNFCGLVFIFKAARPLFVLTSRTNRAAISRKISSDVW